ncbi:hypothetical protein D3C72_528190 [compost metagenome]
MLTAYTRQLRQRDHRALKHAFGFDHGGASGQCTTAYPFKIDFAGTTALQAFVHIVLQRIHALGVTTRKGQADIAAQQIVVSLDGGVVQRFARIFFAQVSGIRE